MASSVAVTRISSAASTSNLACSSFCPFPAAVPDMDLYFALAVSSESRADLTWFLALSDAWIWVLSVVVHGFVKLLVMAASCARRAFPTLSCATA